MASFYAGNIVGHTLGNRYRLLNLIGMGSSARVYLAEDVKLRRRVAVKLLHASLAGDESFLRRFQREAESLAPLTHPNIVIIHDVNDRQNANGEPPYLVTEYLSGGSLRNLLDAGRPITVAQAALVGLGTARGLTFAHAHGVVHRDIKPANLLFGDDQRVRIGDFGLARALADYGRTEPAGALVGTAKYLSPEQARGTANLDGRSDVYSLALVLYEAVTGEVPFTADTWQGTAMARLQNDLVCAHDLGPLGPILEAAATIDPQQRFDAEGFALALESVAKELPRPDPLLLDGSRVLDRAAQLDERDPTLFAVGARTTSAPLDDLTMHAPTSFAPDRTRTNGGAVTTPTGPTGFATPGQAGLPSTDADPSTAITRTTQPAQLNQPTFTKESSELTTSAPKRAKRFRMKAKVSQTSPPSVEAADSRRPRPTKVLAGILAFVLIGGAATGVVIARRTPTHKVPSLVGMTVDAGITEVTDEKFTVVTLPPEFDKTVPAGAIIRQVPDAGQTLKERQQITVVASKGIEPVNVPDVTNLTLEAAVAALEAVGLRSSNPPQFRPDEAVEAGRVVGWNPRGQLAPNSLVTLVVSSGPAQVELPKVRGLSPDAAVAALPTGVGSTLIQVFSDAKVGTVSGSDPKAGTMIRRGDTVKIFVSKGPELIKVPNVINLSWNDAAAQLRAAGLSIGNTFGPADLPVLHTRPLRNTRVKRGTKINLYTTEADVPEVPGVAATRTSTTVLARELVTTTTAP